MSKAKDTARASSLASESTTTGTRGLGVHRLASTICAHKAKLEQTQSSYQTNVANMVATLNSVFSLSLPNLNSYPSNWSSITNAYTTVSAASLDWVNQVYAKLLATPTNVLNNKTDISILFQAMNTNLQILTSDPTNSQALAGLQASLASLNSTMAQVAVFINECTTAITTFISDVPTSVAALQSAVAAATTDYKADQALIKTYQNDISTLQSDVNTLYSNIVELAKLDCFMIIFGLVITGPTAGIGSLFVGAGVATASVYLALDSAKMKADKAQIQADQTAMDAATSDLAALYTLSTQFGNFSTELTSLTASAQAVLMAWQEVARDVAAAVSDISAATSDATSGDFSDAQQEVDDAAAEWLGISFLLSGLSLQAQVNDAQLSCGMSCDQVQQAIAAGTNYDPVTYYNEQSALSLNLCAKGIKIGSGKRGGGGATSLRVVRPSVPAANAHPAPQTHAPVQNGLFHCTFHGPVYVYNK